MMAEKTWVGIDVSKEWLDGYILPQGIDFRQANSEAGLQELTKQLKAMSVDLVVFESTGGLERLLMESLHQAELPARRVNPRKVRGFATALNKAKTDPLDAQVIALFAQAIQPEAQSPVAPEAQQLRDLVGRRRQLVKNLVREKNRLSCASNIVQQSIENLIKYLETEIESVNQQIQVLSEQQPDAQHKDKILRSCKGIGPVTSALLRAELPELGTYSEKKIARLVGVAPINHDSGQRSGKRMIQGGRTSVRCGLFMATWSAIQHNPPIRDFYQRLLNKGKPKMVALVACMRKLLVVLNAMLRDNKSWQVPA